MDDPKKLISEAQDALENGAETLEETANEAAETAKESVDEAVEAAETAGGELEEIAEEAEEEVKSFDESLEKADEQAEEAGEAVIYDVRERKKSKKKEKKSLSSYFKSTRFKKGSFATILTIGFIVIVILFNVFFSILEERFPSLKLDMTENKIYSLSDDALDAAKKIDIDTTVYILASEDKAKDDSLLSYYGLQYSQIPILCEKCAEANPKIHVEYVDLDLNPQFASQTKYQGYKLQSGTVILENARRIRVLGIGDFFTTEYDSNYTPTYYMQTGGALTTGLMQVQAAEIPKIAVATGGHSEALTSSLKPQSSASRTVSFQELMESNNFEYEEFDILTEEIPEDASILLLPTPMTDYTQTELEKMDAFLAESVAKNRAIWVTCDPSQPELPNFSAFLAEWGIELPNNTMIYETDSSHTTTNYEYYFISDLTGDVDIGGIKGTTEYGYFYTPVCRPVTLLYNYNSNNTTYSLAKTTEFAYTKALVTEGEENGQGEEGEENGQSEQGEESSQAQPEEPIEYGVYTTLGLSQKVNKISNVNYNKNVVVFGSSGMFVSSYLTGSTFGNAEYLVDLARYSAGVQDSEIGVYKDKTAVNTYDISITSGARNFFGVGVFTILIPLALIVAGLCVYLRRRHL